MLSSYSISTRASTIPIHQRTHCFFLFFWLLLLLFLLKEKINCIKSPYACFLTVRTSSANLYFSFWILCKPRHALFGSSKMYLHILETAQWCKHAEARMWTCYCCSFERLSEFTRITDELSLCLDAMLASMTCTASRPSPRRRKRRRSWSQRWGPWSWSPCPWRIRRFPSGSSGRTFCPAPWTETWFTPLS